MFLKTILDKFNMKIIKSILYALLGIMSIYVISNFFFDDSFSVESSTTIDSSPYVVYSQIENFENWTNWDPWMKTDTTVSIELSESTNEVGAIRKWRSDHSGNGYMLFSSVEFLSQLDYELHIDNSSPFYSSFNLESDSNSVKLRWKHYGNLPFLTRIFGPVMEKMIKSDQVNGLKNIKEYCEGLYSETLDITTQEFSSKYIIAMDDSCITSEINNALSSIYNEIFIALAENGIMPASSPFVQYFSFPNKSGEKDFVRLRAGVFVEVPLEKEKLHKSNFLTYKTSNHTSVQAIHKGDYSTLYQTHRLILDYCNDNNLTTYGLPYEIFLTDPELTPNSTNWETKIIYVLE